jgi:hypothetical protein
MARPGFEPEPPRWEASEYASYLQFIFFDTVMELSCGTLICTSWNLWRFAVQYWQNTAADKTSNLTPYTLFEYEICGRTEGQTKFSIVD